ncbi:MAG: hypothetical protein OEM02_07730, partial [Desulfobulbaceae bacterium]|nr:hypothetical protein [Desulfobulbaceae bacterium]
SIVILFLVGYKTDSYIGPLLLLAIQFSKINVPSVQQVVCFAAAKAILTGFVLPVNLFFRCRVGLRFCFAKFRAATRREST